MDMKKNFDVWGNIPEEIQIPMGPIFQGNPMRGGAGIATVENHIYFYSDISTRSVFQFVTDLKGMRDLFLAESISREAPVSPIIVHINSFGGSIFAGINAMDAIIKTIDLGVPVYTVIEGSAASAATFLSVVGSKRFITPNSYVLIHQLSTFMGGKFNEIKDEFSNLEKFMDQITKIYEKYTKISKTDIEKILKKDIWWNAEEALENGVIDEIKTF
jgi:ATP-dependent Clp protease protease subunit